MKRRCKSTRGMWLCAGRCRDAGACLSCSAWPTTGLSCGATSSSSGVAESTLPAEARRAVDVSAREPVENETPASKPRRRRRRHRLRRRQRTARFTRCCSTMARQFGRSRSRTRRSSPARRSTTARSMSATPTARCGRCPIEDGHEIWDTRDRRRSLRGADGPRRRCARHLRSGLAGLLRQGRRREALGVQDRGAAALHADDRRRARSCWPAATASCT